MSSSVADRLSEKSKDGVLFKRPGCKYTRFGLKRPHSTRQRVGRHVLVTCLTNTSNLASLKPSSPTNLFTLQIQTQKSPKTGLRHMSYWSQRQILASLSSSTCPCLKCKCQHKKCLLDKLRSCWSCSSPWLCEDLHKSGGQKRPA